MTAQSVKRLTVSVVAFLSAFLQPATVTLFAQCPTNYVLQSARGSSTPVLTRGSYDYAPSIMRDGRYRMWWCGGVAGDWILYADADSLDGPWTTPQAVFQPSTVPGAFDNLHTCDPSVI